MKRPDFGEQEREWRGKTFKCRNMVPGLSLHDLVMIFEAAHKEAGPHDHLAADPGKWPDVRGVKAVTEAILNAIYDD